MALLVCMGASLKCSFGVAPSALMVLPENRTLTNAIPPVANIMDNKPLLNILPFGMCTSPSNPTVAAATAAAAGVLTPMPCIPATAAAPWLPGSPTVLVGSMPALNQSSKLMCMWAGIIQITYPGQTTVQVP